jgi:BlaI family penicillinase repressor
MQPIKLFREELFMEQHTINTESTAKYNITDAEWKIMQILWKHSKISEGIPLGDIKEYLKTQCSWNINTIRTLLVRLADKEIVGAEKQGRNYKYYPLVSQDECVMQETESLLTKIFGGSPSLLVSALIKSGKISEKEQEKIFELINKMGSDEDV